MKAFEARLAALKQRMEAGLGQRAQALKDAADRLDNGDEGARREIKSQSHKLRGIAGTYGHQELTDMAAHLEQRASLSPPPVVAELARELADRADEIGATATAGPLADSQAPAPPAARTETALAGPDRAPIRILAVDDDPVTLKLLRLTLKQIGGFDATIVESARTALSELQRGEFDVVLSDAMMPDMNGLEFCRQARQQGGRAATMPIIILSAATADELGWHQALDQCTNWLRKPFRPSALVKKISQIVEEHESSRHS